MKMNAINANRTGHLTAQFEPDIKFELPLHPGTVSPESVRIRFQALQNRLLEETLGQTPNPILRENLHGVANEAAALAWTTQFPLLLMPVLFQEKARSVRLQLKKQHHVSMRSQQLVDAVTDGDSG